MLVSEEMAKGPIPYLTAVFDEVARLEREVDVLKKELRSQLAWVKHWTEDHRAGLLPTEQSLNDAREAIEKVLK